MEEYNAIEIDAEAESSENEISESFTDTVSGNDAGTDIGMNGQEENQPENNEQTGQDELLESLNALVEVLTPSEEEAETEDGTEPQAEVLPSETETAALDLLEKIYAETATGKTADGLYYEAWAESRTEMQAAVEKAETIGIYLTAVQIGVLFLCAVIAGIQVAKTIWGRFK